MADLLTLDELESLGVNPVAISDFDDTQKELAIAAAVDEAYAWIRMVTTVPLLDAPIALKAHVAKIAVYHLLSARGMDPVADRLVVENYERALRFLKGIQDRKIQLPGMQPPADNLSDDIAGPWVLSDPPRWEV
jgi:phage gp36-like protein